MHTQQEKQKKAWWPFVLAALMFGTMLALGRKDTVQRRCTRELYAQYV